MASENTETPPVPVNATSTTSVKRRGHSRRRTTAAERARERQAPIEDCHVKSLAGICLTLQDGVSQVRFKYYIGEHQSQIFYGGLQIQRPNHPDINVNLGQAVPIDLREIQEGSAPKPCFATPTHIFRRFPANRISSSASCDFKKVAGDAASPDESDTSCPTTGDNGKNPFLLFHFRIPKCGLPLVTFRVHFPVQYMASANELHQGIRRKFHYPPHHDEVVAYQAILTMEVNEFVSRVFRGYANIDLLTNCSSELPVPTTFCAAVKTEQDTAATHQNGLPNAFPTFLILPFGAYNRLLTMKKRLTLGYPSPPRSELGVPMRLTKATAADRDAKGESTRALSWAEWTGLDDAVAIPSWVISKVINGESPANVRIVFVRRQSEDCGDAIWGLLRKSEFCPARIRRTRAKGTDQLVMKVKQLLPTTAANSSTEVKAEENGEKKEGDALVLQSQPLVAPPHVTHEALNFREVWSRDYRSDPYVRNSSLGPLLSLDEHTDVTEAPPSANMNAPTNMGNTNVEYVVHNNCDQQNQNSQQQQQQPQPYHRPTRACLPPQRLQSVDRELAKAIHRSLTEKHKSAVCGKEIPALSKARKQRQKRATNSFNSKPEEQGTGEKASHQQTGMKRTYSEAELRRLDLKTTTDSEAENAHSGKKHRANSPSATSDSAVSTNRSRKDVKRKKATDHPSENKNKNRKMDDRRPSKKMPTIKTDDSSTAFILSRSKNCDMRLERKRSFSRHGRSRAPAKTTETPIVNLAASTLEADDPYALPSSPVNNGTRELCPPVILPKKKERSPSPDPPVLLPEGELETGSCESQNGIAMGLNGESRTNKEEVEGHKIIYSQILDDYPAAAEEAPILSELQITSPPLLSVTSTTENTTNGGHPFHPSNHQSVNGYSNGLPSYSFSLSSTLQPHVGGGNQPISSTNFPSQPPSVVSSDLLSQVVINFIGICLLHHQ
ncbi:hypothetical protein Aperf_G00000066904 [Anoplocephala perfoliata]